MSTVLLQNTGGLLPLDPAKKQKIVLFGADATIPYTGGSGSGAVDPGADVVSPLAALAALGHDVSVATGDPAAAAAAAAVAIVFGSAHTGGGHDRLNLTLGGGIDALIPVVGAAQKNTVVVRQPFHHFGAFSPAFLSSILTPYTP